MTYSFKQFEATLFNYRWIEITQFGPHHLMIS
uniref:Uncharacterized protein n=1 Tax=Anguilla anguilla TaxID=7936 RepID=A0A0E9SED0_ANGAN